MEREAQSMYEFQSDPKTVLKKLRSNSLVLNTTHNTNWLKRKKKNFIMPINQVLYFSEEEVEKKVNEI